MTPDLPQPTNRYADLSREELVRRLRIAELERIGLTSRLVTAEDRLERLRAAFLVLQELAEEEE